MWERVVRRVRRKYLNVRDLRSWPPRYDSLPQWCFGCLISVQVSKAGRTVL